MKFSGYRSMWILVLFDLPTDTRKSRKQYALFRKKLIQEGFSMMQYSVYYRHCASRENLNVYTQRVRSALPPDGEVRVMEITDKQFDRMSVFWGKKRKPTEAAPAQLELF